MRGFKVIVFIFIVGGLNAQTVLPIDVSSITNKATQSERYNSPKAASNFEIIELPMPSGEVIEFVIKHAPLVKEGHSLYKTSAGNTYRLHSPITAGYNGNMVVYKNGIHVTLNTPDGFLFIKRESINQKNGRHIYTYFKDTNGFPHQSNDAIYPSNLPLDKSIEHSHGDGVEHVHNTSMNLKANNNFFSIGGNNTRRVVDLFVVSDKSFVDSYGGNVTNATNRVVEVVNGTRTFWEQDFNITINYMGVYFDPAVVGAGTAGAQQIWNSITDANIPNGTKADVDLAHFFAGNGGGGAANLWVACDAQSKASGYSGSQDPSEASFIPLVAHEMAHQMGADHTWTGQDQACTFDQWGKNSGVEPGSGNTLAGYAGICGDDNIPGGKGDYHHIESMREVLFYVRQGTGKNFSTTTITQAGQIPAYGVNYGLPNCITTEAFANAVPQANANPNNLANLNIPGRTPFELDGSATDADGNPLTYQWDQLDFALAQQPIDGYATRPDGPLFRSYGPSANTTRVFPKLNDILTNTQVAGEILPQTNRPMRFALVVRDGRGGVGVDTVGLQVVDSGQGFSITENINTSNPANVTINWNVANSNIAPISCSNVTILYSTDGGQTFPHTVVASTANDGSATVNLSTFGNTTQGRIKVKCATSVFFDINNSNLTTSGSGTGGGNCVANLNVNAGTINTNQLASATISTSGNVAINGGLAFSAPDISLNEGFEVPSGNCFEANNVGCAFTGTVDCNGGGGGQTANGTCAAPFVLTCGQNYNGNTATGSNNFDDQGDYPATDNIHTISVPANTTYTITLSNLNADLDLFGGTVCDVAQMGEFSGNGGTANESISLNNATGGAVTYFILVDGFGTATSTYTLSCSGNAG